MTVRTGYQLFATGASVNGWKFQMRSKTVYTAESQLEAGKKDFEAKCRNPESFDYVAAEDAIIMRVIEVEIVEADEGPA